jgi:hypothetical protein
MLRLLLRTVRWMVKLTSIEHFEYERNLIESALELFASSQSVPLQLHLTDGRDGAPRIDNDK